MSWISDTYNIVDLEMESIDSGFNPVSAGFIIAVFLTIGIVKSIL